MKLHKKMRLYYKIHKSMPLLRSVVIRWHNINYNCFFFKKSQRIVSCILQADERAVLKHFKWPEKKADAMREAAVEYHELKMLEQEISSYKDDPDIPCGAALKKMGSLLDKLDISIQIMFLFIINH